MNIEEAIEKGKEFINYMPIGARIISFRKGQFMDCQIAIETLLTAYEKEKELLELASNMLDNIDYDQIPIAIGELKSELEKEKEKNKNAYRKANNYLYFNDSADYEVALWEVIRTLRPDLAKKWDNGEDAELKYIEEE